MLRSAVGGSSAVTVDGATIGEILDELGRRFPALAGQVVTDDGSLHKFVNIYLNDDDIRYLAKLDTKVGEGDTVSILPAVAGGA
jgi:molybdopterin converting factor small subunit